MILHNKGTEKTKIKIGKRKWKWKRRKRDVNEER